jgi:hypothetical protein
MIMTKETEGRETADKAPTIKNWLYYTRNWAISNHEGGSTSGLKLKFADGSERSLEIVFPTGIRCQHSPGTRGHPTWAW